jgi:hypothetical protein
LLFRLDGEAIERHGAIGYIITQFADNLLTLAPDFPMGVDEIQALISEKGLSCFISETGGDAAGLAEIAELLARLEKGGGYESG